MNSKECIYKNCENTSVRNKNLTFFCFPLKDTNKCERWAELAGCTHQTLKNKYLCEEHFNPIYLSRTPRRTVLLANAAPYPYFEHQSDNDEASHTQEKTELLNFELEDDTFNGIECEQLENGNEHEEEEEANQQQEIEKGPLDEKRPIRDDLLTNVTKRLKTNNSRSREQNSMDEEITDDSIEFDYTAEHPDITTFIFKGEEYIQMPKRIYLAQRKKLDADLKQLKRFARQIKNLTNNLSDD